MAIVETYSTSDSYGNSITLVVNSRDNDPGKFDNVTWSGSGVLQTFEFVAWLSSDQSKTPVPPTPITFSSRNGQQNIPGNQDLFWVDEGGGEGYWTILDPDLYEWTFRGV